MSKTRRDARNEALGELADAVDDQAACWAKLKGMIEIFKSVSDAFRTNGLRSARDDSLSVPARDPDYPARRKAARIPDHVTVLSAVQELERADERLKNARAQCIELGVDPSKLS